MHPALLTAGSVLGFLGVALGAFGAHALEARLDAHAKSIYQTGVQYHLVHALAVVLCAVWAREHATAATAGWAFVGGVVVFSGSLYLLAVTGRTWLGAVTPLGGLALLAGWLLLAWTGVRG